MLILGKLNKKQLNFCVKVRTAAKVRTDWKIFDAENIYYMPMLLFWIHRKKISCQLRWCLQIGGVGNWVRVKTKVKETGMVSPSIRIDIKDHSLLKSTQIVI